MPSQGNHRGKEVSDLRTINIIIAGVGGQGNLFSSRLIALAALNKGFYVAVGETYGAAQRGGSVMSHLRIGQKEVGPLIPQHSAHILLGFEPAETLRVGASYLNPQASVIMNTHPIYPAEVLTGQLEYPPTTEIEEKIGKLCSDLWTLDAVELATKTGSPLVMNTVMVGALIGSQLTPLTQNDLEQVISSQIRRLQKVNLEAFKLGFKTVRKVTLAFS